MKTIIHLSRHHLKSVLALALATALPASLSAQGLLDQVTETVEDAESQVQPRQPRTNPRNPQQPTRPSSPVTDAVNQATETAEEATRSAPTGNVERPNRPAGNPVENNLQQVPDAARQATRDRPVNPGEAIDRTTDSVEEASQPIRDTAETVTTDAPTEAATDTVDDATRDVGETVESRATEKVPDEPVAEDSERSRPARPDTNAPDSPIPTKNISRSELEQKARELRDAAPDARETVTDTTESVTDATESLTDTTREAVEQGRDADDQARPDVEPSERQRPESTSASELVGRARQLVEGRPEPDTDQLRRQAERIDSEDQASQIVNSILGAATGEVGKQASPTLQRLSPDVVGRSRQDRQSNVAAIVNALSGGATANASARASANASARARAGTHSHYDHRYHFHEGNRRVVRYTSRNQIPPILLASHRLNRLHVTPVRDAGYIDRRPDWVQPLPDTYRGPEAHAVSYQVDPDSAVSRDDILFQQGSTAFADAYSYDIVADLAEAMLDSRLRNHQFVIEGHASAEGGYSLNLDLSQRRAERVARDLVGYGVDPNRLIPVGYGETEARYPADARESLRSLDRRVVVFRLE